MNSIKKLVISLEPFYPGASLSASGDLEPVKALAGQDEEKINLADSEVSEEVSTILKPSWLSAVNVFAYDIFIRPLLLVLLLITFPFTYFFGQEYPAMETGLDMDTRRGSLGLDIDEKTELLKQEKIMANRIKSPTASQYIIPPPPRLFPRSRNPDKKRKKKTLILDLDETLIHSLSRGAPRSLGSSGSCHMIELKVNSVATLYYVYKRPFCDFFLREISRWFELQIFTASVKEYADPIIDWLESEIVDLKLANKGSQSIFTKRYYRGDCTYRPGVGYIKDLSKILGKDDDLKNVIILDNSPISYALQEHNGVMIEGWINDQNDRDLLNLLPMLYSLSLCIDVRFILGLRSGEKLFEDNYKR